MIGKYTDEDFIKELTVSEQREYLISLVKEMDYDYVKEIYDAVINARSEAFNKITIEDLINPDRASHFWEEK